MSTPREIYVLQLVSDVQPLAIVSGHYATAEDAKRTINYIRSHGNTHTYLLTEPLKRSEVAPFFHQVEFDPRRFPIAETLTA